MDFILLALSDTLRAVLTMSAAGSAAVLLLFIVKVLARDKLSKTFQYYLWVATLAAFIVPLPKLIEYPAFDAQTRHASVNGAFFILTENSVFEPDFTAHDAVQSETSMPLFSILAAVWLAGVFIIIGFNLYCYLKFVSRVKKRAVPLDSPDIFFAGASTKQRRRPEICRCAAVDAPILVGLLRPAILLPERKYTNVQLKNILLHEMTHHRRRDVFVKWLSMLASSIHWFNPAVYFLRRETAFACELACDEAVIKNFNSDGRSVYGNALIDSAAAVRTTTAVALSSEKSALKRRLVAIMSKKKSSGASVFLSCALSTAVAAVIILTGASGFAAEKPPVEINFEEPFSFEDAATDGIEPNNEIIQPVNESLETPQNQKEHFAAQGELKDITVESLAMYSSVNYIVAKLSDFESEKLSHIFFESETLPYEHYYRSVSFRGDVIRIAYSELK